MAARKVGKLAIDSTAFFLCDIQERFRSIIRYMPSVIHVANLMVKSSRILGLPTVATEQYPKALGRTVPEIDIAGIDVVEKTDFSMVPALDTLLNRWTASQIQSIVLFGIEAHVCVQQTALDLIEKGYDVHVLADGTSSTRDADRKIAFERMRDAGAFITTSESVLFQLLGNSRHSKFKDISALCKEQRPESGLS